MRNIILFKSWTAKISTLFLCTLIINPLYWNKWEECLVGFIAYTQEIPQKENTMGEKGSKKDKNKAGKQKQEKLEKKEEQKKAKLPAKKP